MLYYIKMKISNYILILFILISSCSSNNEIRTLERTAVIFNGYNELMEEMFNATIINKGGLKYKYVSQVDSTKTIEITINEDSQEISFGFDEYRRADRIGFKEEKLSDKIFHYYDMKEPVIDGTGPILFNDDYGLLAINNVFGPTIIFLTHETIELKRRVLDSLNK